MNQCHKTKGGFLCDSYDCDYNRDRPAPCEHEINGKCFCYYALTDILGPRGRQVGEAWLNMEEQG